jgi:hypothetical protein
MLLAQHERIHGKVEVISLVPTKIQNKKGLSQNSLKELERQPLFQA